MKTPALPALRSFLRIPSRLGATALLAAGSLLSAGAADLVKADNATELGAAGAYAAPNGTAVPTGSDTIVFNDTLATHSSFSWTSNRSVLGLRVENPANAISIALAGAAFDWTNTGGTVIDLSSAAQNLTLTTSSANAVIRARGSSDTATFSVAGGRTLRIQTNLFYNNVLNNTTSTLRVTGAGNVTVDGTHGRVSDKNIGNGALTAIKHEGSGTLTLANANTYSGGTDVASGTLVAGAGKALGDGAVSVSGGTLDLNGAGTLGLTLAANRDFSMTAGTLKLDLGTSHDQIAGGGTGKFTLSGGTLAITLGEGFSYDAVYQVFDGFSSVTSTAAGVTFTGFDTNLYQASLNSLGQLSFSLAAVPEPSSFALLAGMVMLAGAAGRRRLKRAV